MQKRVRNSHVKTIAFSEISLMILATFAFAFVLAESNQVSAAETAYKDKSSGIVWKTDQISTWRLNSENKWVPGLPYKPAMFGKTYFDEVNLNYKYPTTLATEKSTELKKQLSNTMVPTDALTLIPKTIETIGKYTLTGGVFTVKQQIGPGSNLEEMIPKDAKITKVEGIEGGITQVTYEFDKQKITAKLGADGTKTLKDVAGDNLIAPAVTAGTTITPYGIGKYTITGEGFKVNQQIGLGSNLEEMIPKDAKITKVEGIEGGITQVTYEFEKKIYTANLDDGGTKTLKDMAGKDLIAPTSTAVTTISQPYGIGAALKDGFTFAVMIGALVQMFGPAAGLDASQTDAVSLALSVGIILGHLGSSTKLLGPAYGWIPGAVIGLWILLATYKDTKKYVITFTCSPWQAPTGGSDCKKCNTEDPTFKPCSEYRCKSLGQACELLNKETPGKEMCAWKNPGDTLSPSISPANGSLASRNEELNLKFINDTSIRPPALGVRIVKDLNSCLPAFTALQFGINTDEPAQCKIDYNHTSKFDQMEFYFGDSYYGYNHTLNMRLPGPDTFATNNSEEGSPVFKNDGTTQLLVRCRDSNGNENVDEYSIKFCVDPSPDTTPPKIEGTEIPSGNYIRDGVLNISTGVYVNEPANCSWSIEDKAYKDMENKMGCEDSPQPINAVLTYICNANLTGLKSKAENKFYFRCIDFAGKNESDRNVMVQSYTYILKGSQPLNIVKVGPNETITDRTSAVTVSLELETANGAEEGKAWCTFSPSGANDSFVPMFETANYLHKQTLQLTAGIYPYYFECADAGGNIDRANTSFTVFSDTTPPQVARVYRDAGTEGLKIVTNEDAECVYSLSDCNFEFESGLPAIYSNTNIKTNSYVPWKPNIIYYVKCRDLYDDIGNRPDPGKCSIIVKPVESTRAAA